MSLPTAGPAFRRSSRPRSLRRRRTAVRCLGLAVFVAVGCSSADAPRLLASRDTLPDGVVVVAYPSLAGVPVDTLVPELRIGRIDGTGPDVFGDVRGIDVAADGTVYVLDGQAAELRAFSANGEHAATLTRRGQGPGEVESPNGFVVGPDGTIWVLDGRQRRIVGLSPSGEEVARHPMVTRGIAYFWNAAIDERGTFWQTESHAVEPEPADRPEGRYDVDYRLYYKSFDPSAATSGDPATGQAAYDSVFLTLATVRGYMITFDGGWAPRALPFSHRPLTAVDRSASFWVALSGAYDLARLDASGDTIMILRVDETGPSVTSADVDEWVETATAGLPSRRFMRADIEPYVPEHKPALDRLVTDDQNRLWARRAATAGELPRYDVFDSTGTFLGAVRMAPDLWLPFTPVIRGGRVYGVARDSLDVPYVIAAPVPSFQSVR